MAEMRSARRDAVLELLQTKGLRTFAEPVQLASGELSHHFIDGKEALRRGRDLRLACEAMVEVAHDAGVEFDAVGGLTMGADQFAHGIAIVADCDWFVIRKAPKGRGTNKVVEGTPLGAGVRVLLVDDIITTGGSIQQAYEQVAATGATVTIAMTLVDRGENAADFFAARQIAYRPLVTYRDLGIPPVQRTTLT